MDKCNNRYCVVDGAPWPEFCFQIIEKLRTRILGMVLEEKSSFESCN